jgi:tellurite resistance protein
VDKNRSDEILKVLASAYVWVASADSGVDEIELVKYEHIIVGSPFATQFEVDHIRRYFKDMVAMFADDFEAAIQLTKSRLEQIKDQGILAEEVIRVCRAAAVGDGKLEDVEDVALSEIAKTLGIRPDIG